MTMRSALGRARGLGSARQGVQHWWAMRASAAALVPLCLWLTASLIALAGADHARFASWVAYPFNAVALLLLLGVAFYHLKVGLDVVIEDYVHTEWRKVAVATLTTFAVVAAAAASGFAVLKLALT